MVGAMGIKAAKRLSLLSERIGPDEALAMGIVNQVLPDNELAAATEKLAQRLAASPAPPWR
ncbi:MULTISPECIES: enoyl-CoA hydratase-related protein [Pseudomonas]|uniref:enoyl-CoA hydratase-related protein n=1 Tax=Pseudomonas TaxID=286 RepID=UPI00211410D7|nr:MULTISPECIES: enoyl-CoA hydratase-related protein [Pseudomonas]MDH0639298.1 enoyl-CoA hydratase-related protein [Pseudomonas sp. GD03860]